jgi:enediyne biosynthesis protein E4
LKKKFLTYKEFGKATITDIFSAEEMKDAVKLQANNFQSSYVENLGEGKFKLHSLPLAAQTSLLYAMVVDDFNMDGNLDIAINGNDFGTEIGNGRYDALNGLLLVGDGKGNFAPLSILQSGLFIPGDGKALIKCRGVNGKSFLAASQNNGQLKLFSAKQQPGIVELMPGDKYCIYSLRNGKKRKEEFYTGNSYLSQSSFFITTNQSIVSIEIINNKGNKRTIQ